MSKYTTEVRYICEVNSGMNESVGYSKIEDVITGAIPKIFDFDFPIFDEKYRTVLERKILKHFYTREIGEETVGLWKLRLDTKLNEIMPYYNKLYESELLEFNPLYTSNLTRKHDTKSNNTNNETINSNNTNTTDGNGSETNTGNSKDKYSDTPQGGLTNVENGTYLTNARIIEDESKTTSNTHNEGKSIGNVVSNGVANTTENYLETVVGYDGTDASKLLQDYRDTFLNIDLMIINELEDLFFQLW